MFQQVVEYFMAWWRTATFANAVLEILVGGSFKMSVGRCLKMLLENLFWHVE